MQTLKDTRRAKGAAQITMSRPEVFTACHEAMTAELDSAYADLADDADTPAIVRAGEGRHFSAGADIQWMQRASEASREWNLADARRFAAMLQRIAGSPKPTVARVQGAALGGGVGLTCACDIAIAADNAGFVVSEAKFGILPGAGAAEALAIGLVQQVAPLDALDAAVDAVVADLIAGGPQAQREIKQLCSQFEVGPITSDVRELTAQTLSRMRGTDEAREGFAAFLGKRPAPWSPQ